MGPMGRAGLGMRGWGLASRAENTPRKTRQFFSLWLQIIITLCVTSFPCRSFALDAIVEAEAFDMPGDGGGSIGLRWNSPRIDAFVAAEARYQIFLSDRAEGGFHQIATFPVKTHYERDRQAPWWLIRTQRPHTHFFQVSTYGEEALVDETPYYLKVVGLAGETRIESPVLSATPQANCFHWAKLNNFLFTLAFSAGVLFSIRYARTHPKFFLRRIPGIDAVEEAVGRATEMGRPILYLTGSGELTGSGDASNLSTIAATVILGEVAKRAAVYGTAIKVPHRSAIVMAISQEIVREAYLTAGRLDAYSDDINFFIAADQFAYTAAVDGIMLRERPAANFFIGYYYAESLLLAETGVTTGAIQIAGTDAEHQLPFFITSCDYTLIGEELYAASAYLSRDPALVGTLRGQDLGKGFLLVGLVLGTLLITVGTLFGLPIFETAFQVFHDFR